MSVLILFIHLSKSLKDCLLFSVKIASLTRRKKKKATALSWFSLSTLLLARFLSSIHGLSWREGYLLGAGVCLQMHCLHTLCTAGVKYTQAFKSETSGLSRTCGGTLEPPSSCATYVIENERENPPAFSSF